MEDNKSNSLHALLIAIDCYLPNRLPMGGYYPSLGGCVSDINRIENFLTQKLGLASDNILKLTASNTGKTEPSEPSENWPTYDNMVRAFNQVVEKDCIRRSGLHILLWSRGANKNSLSRIKRCRWTRRDSGAN